MVKATDGSTRQHLNVLELKALLGNAKQRVGGKRGELITTARQHAALLVSSAKAAQAAPAGDAAAPAGDAADITTTSATAAAGAVEAAANDGGRASVTDGSTPTSALRAALPKGMKMTGAKAATLAAVFATCGALANAQDSALRDACSDGHLPGMGIGWLRRVHASIQHLKTAAATDAAVAAAADAAVATAATDRDGEVVGAGGSAIGGDAADGSATESSDSESDSEIGSAISDEGSSDGSSDDDA